MSDPNGGTFIDIPQLFRDPQFLKQKLQHVKDRTVLDFWTKQFPASQRSNEAGEVTAWFVSKFGAFLSNEMMRNIIGQTKSSLDLRYIMDNKKILLVNLSKGRTGDLNSKLLGMIFVMKFQAAAMSRATIPEEERVDFSLYVDEFQNFSTDSFATIMSEARKYHLNLIVANQFTTQLTQEIRDAVFGNMGTIVSFRIGQNDLESLSKYFQPIFNGDDLLRIPNYNTIVRTLIGGVPTQPFSMTTLPSLGTPNPRLAEALKQLSAAKYGQPKAVIEKNIFARMATKEAPRPPAGNFGTAPFGSNNAAPAPFAGSPGPQNATGQSFGPATTPTSPAPAAAAGGSFLDEWLSKRRSGTVSPPPAQQPYRPPAASTNPSPSPSYSAPPSAAPTRIVEPPVASTPSTPHIQHATAAVGAMPPQSAPASVANAPFTPASPTARPTEQPKNISSDELEQSEINKIAAELKGELGAPRSAAQRSTKTEADIELKPGEDDTIFIDRDGTFRPNDPS
jgi:hypothetical protein